MAKFIFGELYSTEKSFHTLLKFTYNVSKKKIRSNVILLKKKKKKKKNGTQNYMKTMEKAVQGRYSLVKASDVHVLFYALPEMMGVSEKLLAYLKGYMDGVVYQDCTPGMALGHIFKLLENDMVAFLKYATHHKTNIKSMRKARNSGFITKIENQLQLQKANNRLDLADYLIAPFQRVPRYGLLIKGNIFIYFFRKKVIHILNSFL
jgi:hypothetical protein